MYWTFYISYQIIGWAKKEKRQLYSLVMYYQYTGGTSRLCACMRLTVRKQFSDGLELSGTMTVIASSLLIFKVYLTTVLTSLGFGRPEILFTKARNSVYSFISVCAKSKPR